MSPLPLGNFSFGPRHHLGHAGYQPLTLGEGQVRNVEYVYQRPLHGVTGRAAIYGAKHLYYLFTNYIRKSALFSVDTAN